VLQDHDIVRLILRYQDAWFSHFPGQSRRAEWHILHHLCLKGRNGSPVGELYGLVKQVFLLDDATVKERLLSIAQAGYCGLDPPGHVFSRTVATPTPALLARFDAHLRDFADILAEAAGTPRVAVPAVLTPGLRVRILRPLDVYAAHWSAAVDEIFDQGRLSPARRSDAKRNLISSSHWNLLHNAMNWQYEAGPAETGILADRLAARLLELTGQTLQTTKDHIGYLIEIGLFRRMKGKALHIRVPDPAMRHLEAALRETAAELPAMVQAVFDTIRISAAALDDDASERTLNVKQSPARPPKPRHFLEIVLPLAAARRIEVGSALTIGRAPPSDLTLNSADISRSHCRIDSDGEHLVISDLGSTNGTYVNDRPIAGATLLTSGDQLRVGSYVLHYTDESAALDNTQRGQVVTMPVRGRKTSG
jgi:hypothetical protein